MSEMEKHNGLEPVAGRWSRRGPSETKRRFASLSLFAFLALCLYWRGLHFTGLSQPAPASKAKQCPQADPLRPENQTPALDAMDARLASPAYRNKSIAALAGAVRVPTQSYDDMGPIGTDPRWDVMFNFAEYLRTTFPLVHGTLSLEKVNTHGLLYTWAGSDVSLKPTLLMAHQDVVPVAPATVGTWTHPPFSGFYDGRSIWGRGSADTKNSLVGILEAVEALIEADFKPKRTLVLSFGFDEEISGEQGAGHLAPFLLERYGKDGLAVIVDEGSGIGEFWGRTFAAPAVAEKGYIDVEVVVRMPGGHSSVPPPHTGIGVLAELITMVEAHPYRPHLHEESPVLGLLHCGDEHAPEFPKKLSELLSARKKPTCAGSAGRLGSSWSIKTKHDKLAEEVATLNDMVKYIVTTSLAVDVIEGGVKFNALPERTRAVVNHRVNVGDVTSDVKGKISALAGHVAKKYNLTLRAFEDEEADAAEEPPRSITLREHGTLEPAPVTPTEIGDTPYGVLAGTTRALYEADDFVMAPGIMTGNTDTRFYWDLTRHIFRYIPGWDPEMELGLGGIHTVDERMSVAAHIKGVQWYASFVRNMDEAKLE